MRGLTDEERAELVEGIRGDHGRVLDGEPRLLAIANGLVERGTASWVPGEDENFTWQELRTNTLGELALRVDAAARAKGVWP